MNNKRIVWIDQLKAIGFFFVILGHLEINETFQLWIYSFHMPLFLLVTGLTFNFDKAFRTDFKTFFLTRVKRLIIPYFWMSMISLSILYLRRLILGGSIPDLSDYLMGILLANTRITKVAPSPALYYVVLLFFSEIGLWFIIKIARNKKPYILLLLLAVLPASLLTINAKVVLHLNVVPVAMLLIFIGRILMDLYQSGYKEKLDALSSDRYFCLCALMLIAGSALAFINERISIHANKYGREFIAFLACALLINIALALITMRLPDSRLFTYIGQSTLFYMGMHSEIKNVLEQIGRTFTSIESAEFITAALLILFFGLAPLSKITDRYFPFVSGKSTTVKDRKTLLCQTFMTFFAFAAVYYTAVSHLAAAYLPSLLSGALPKVGFHAAATVIWALVCLVGCIAARKIFPAVFLIEKQRPAVKSGNGIINS